MLSYVRAIYIPVAHSASKDYPHLSTWVQVNFCFDRDVSIWRGADHFLNHKCNKLKGLNMWANSAVGLDIPGLVALLTVPRQFRKVNPYTARLIRIVPTESIKTVGVTKTLKDSNDFSWKDIQSAHSGLDLMWKKPEKSTWFEDFTKNATTFAIGFIPVAGPFLAIAFNLTWSALRDEDQFWNDLKLWAPGIKLAEEFKIDFRQGIAEIRLFVDDAWLTSQTGSLPGKINGKPSNVEENDFKNAEKVIESSAAEDVNTGAEDPKIKEGVLIEIAAEA